MPTNKLLAGLIIAIGSVCAQPSESLADEMVGKVGTVFVRESRGLYIEKKLLRKVENKELWADIHFETSRVGHVVYELFKLSPEAAIEHGDWVMTKVGDSSGLAYNILAEPNEVTKLVAKHHALMAMTFGLPKSGNSETALLDAFLK